MSLSYTQAASQTLERIEKYCRQSTGSSNTWKTAEGEYFWEIDEQACNGSNIAGDVYLNDHGYSNLRGSFWIDASGLVNHFAHLPEEAYNQRL